MAAIFFSSVAFTTLLAKKSGIIGLRKLVAVEPKPRPWPRGQIGVLGLEGQVFGLGLGHQAIGLVGCDLDSVFPKLAKGLNRRCDLNYNDGRDLVMEQVDPTGCRAGNKFTS